MSKLQGEILTLPKMSGSVSAPKSLSGNVGAKTINIGQDGATFVPSVSADGVISWTNDRELDNPQPVNIKGKDGYTPIKNIDYFDGKDGKNGIDGKDGYTPIKGKDYFDGINGKDGSDGVDGVGIKSVAQTTTSTADDGNNVITVTLTNGTKSTFKVQNGSKGSTGKDGYTPVKGVDYFDGVDGKDGSNGKDGVDGKTPVKGTDYYTEADKAEMVQAVISALPVYNGEVVSV